MTNTIVLLAATAPCLCGLICFFHILGFPHLVRGCRVLLPAPGFLMAQASHCSAELIERRDVTSSLAVFRFLVAEQLAFIAGQFATIGMAADGDVIERPYSIVSSPYERFLEFFVELVPGGILTPKLWELKLGSTILVRRRIVGQFTLDTSVQPSPDAGHRHGRGPVCEYSESSTN